MGAIWYFQGSGGTWTRAQGTLRGRVLAAADDGSSTFLLYQSSTGVWIAKRPHTGGLVNVQRVSTATQGGGALTSGDLVAFTDQWWAVWTSRSARPPSSPPEAVPEQDHRRRRLHRPDRQAADHHQPDRRRRAPLDRAQAGQRRRQRGRPVLVAQRRRPGAGRAHLDRVGRLHRRLGVPPAQLRRRGRPQPGRLPLGRRQQPRRLRPRRAPRRLPQQRLRDLPGPPVRHPGRPAAGDHLPGRGVRRLPGLPPAPVPGRVPQRRLVEPT